MINLSSHFATTWETPKNTYDVFGSFTALPGWTGFNESSPCDIIAVKVYVTEQGSGFRNLPTAHSLYIRDNNGIYTILKAQNKCLVPIENAFTKNIEVSVLNAYNEAVERIARREDDPGDDLSALEQFFN